MARTVICPACNCSFPTEKPGGAVFCRRCGNRFEIPPPRTAAPPPPPEPGPEAPAGEPPPLISPELYGEPRPADGIVKSQLRLASSFLNTDLASPAYDSNMKKARQAFTEILQDDDHNALAWLGLFNCTLNETVKTFHTTPRFEDSDYWFTADRFTSADYYQMDSYFCRTQAKYGRSDTYVVDEVLQPGRKAAMYLARALDSADEAVAADMRTLHAHFFEKPQAELPQIAKRAIVEHERLRLLKTKEREKNPRR